MQLTFAGTKANTATLCDHHALHSSLLVQSGRTRLLIDCGRDWLGRWQGLAPTALILTHAHEDHSGGLGLEPSCPVYATKTTLARLTPTKGEIVALEANQPLRIGAITLLPFPVDHSRRAPMTGLRLAAGGKTCIYCPDIAALGNPTRVLAGADLYIGDGSCFHRDLRRQERGETCGHAPIPQQLGWCAQAKLSRVLFSHCGEEIVEGERQLSVELTRLGEKLGLQVGFARDGEKVDLTAAQKGP